MRAFSQKLRVALTVLAAGLATGNFWWFARPQPGKEMDYQLQPGSVDLITDRPDELPLFDETSNLWLIEGKLQRSVVGQVTEQRTPHGLEHFLAFRLNDNAGMNTVRRALMAVTNEGICDVGIYDGESVKGTDEKQERIGMFIILWVKDDKGLKRKCEQGVPIR